jgi:DNA-directed RNA polymerase specialized sigma24 family protein
MEGHWRGRAAADPIAAALNDTLARKVDPDAERFVREHHPRVRTYLTTSGCPPPLAEEIANDSALVMVNRWARLHLDATADGAGHADRADGQGDGELGRRAYMFTTARRLWFRNGPRESRWRDCLVLDTPAGVHAAEESDHGSLMHDLVIDHLIAYDIVHQTLPKLTPPYREVLWLRHAEDLPTLTTAGILRIPENTAKTRLRVAIRLFKEHLKAAGAITGTAWEEAL